MFKKMKSKLVSLAFNELHEGQANALKSQIESDPELLEEFNSARSLADDLKLLRDVPECQLGNDRLRSALLSSAIHVPKSLDWSSILSIGSVVSAFLILGFVWHSRAVSNSTSAIGTVMTPNLAQSNPLDNPGQTRALEQATPATKAQSKRSHHSTDRSDFASKFAMSPNLLALNLGEGKAELTDGSHRSQGSTQLTSRHDFGNAMQGRSNDSSKPLASAAEVLQKDGSSQKKQAGAAGSTGQSEQSPGLVTLQPKKDSSTGLPVAKEEPHDNDVPLGG